jgi:hypothetical protein
MWQVLRYTAEHGCAAKIGGPWLEVARLLEREGFLELRDLIIRDANGQALAYVYYEQEP